MAVIYTIFENWDEYPEDGGGLQGIVGMYDNLTSAQKMCDALNRAYNSDGYGYYIEEHKLNYCTEPIPQLKTYLDYWYKPYDENYTRGIRMNLSERREYDRSFPHHPLSEQVLH